MAIAFKHLAKRPDGRTHIVGRRLTPYDMLCQHELGDTPETLSEEYDLSLAEVYEALAYAFDHPDEMERIREDNKAADERMIDQLPEHLREIARQTAAADELAYQETARQTREACCWEATTRAAIRATGARTPKFKKRRSGFGTSYGDSET